MKNYFDFTLKLLLALFLFGCDSNEDTLPPSPYCFISSDFHFAGDVNGVAKSFVEYEENYQKYVGEIGYSDSDPIGRFVFGMNTWPINVGDENVLIHTPEINTEDIDAVVSLFPRGDLNLEQRKKFKIYYYQYKTQSSVDNLQPIVLQGKFDEASTFEVCKVEKELDRYGYKLKVRIKFSCKLYNVGLHGEPQGEIFSGEMTGLLSVNDY